MKQTGPDTVECRHETLGDYCFFVDVGPEDELPELLFTENETNSMVSVLLVLNCEEHLPSTDSWLANRAEVMNLLLL